MTIRVANVLNSPGFGGVPRVATALARRLDRRDFSLYLFFLNDHCVNLAQYRQCFDRVDVATPHARRLDVIGQLVAWLAAHRIDILHTHSYRPNIYARLAGALGRPRGLQVVAHYHNYYDKKWNADPAGLSIERHLIDSTDAYVAVSEAVSKHITESLAVPRSKIRVIYNGVDQDRLACADKVASRRYFGIDQHDIVVGMIGRICHQKGVDTFVDAALELANRFPQMSFVVVGDDEDHDLSISLASKIAVSGLTNRIRISGFHDDVSRVYGAIDMLCVPSRWEGFGLVLVEAMHLGIPIVAANVGAVPEVLGNTGAGSLVPPDDVDALVKTIGNLAVCPNRLAVMGQKGRLQASKYNWDKSATEIAALYRHVVGAR